MAPRFKSIYMHVATPLAVVCALVLLIAMPATTQAHQLINAQGQLVAHTHVYKRDSYGQNFIVGHVAPTRHGHNMIIWSPAPSNSYGSAVPQMHITKPNRQSQAQRQQAPQSGQPIQNLRDLNPRDRR